MIASELDLARNFLANSEVKHKFYKKCHLEID